ncbi:MAG: hotdog domain-containing protein [Hyphomicrobiaceae bacterium]
MSTERPRIGTRTDYRHFLAIPTRWMDNDVYGHVNNVVYYSYFDTLINRYLIDAGGLDFREGPIIGLAVESLCRYHKSFAYPDQIEGGLRVGRLGTSSVRYEIGLFLQRWHGGGGPRKDISCLSLLIRPVNARAHSAFDARRTRSLVVNG